MRPGDVNPSSAAAQITPRAARTRRWEEEAITRQVVRVPRFPAGTSTLQRLLTPWCPVALEISQRESTASPQAIMQQPVTLEVSCGRPPVRDSARLPTTNSTFLAREDSGSLPGRTKA